MQLTLDSARPEAELILFVDASHRPIVELAGPSSHAAAAAGGRARDVGIWSGNLQLDIRDKEFAFGSLLRDGDFLLP